MFEYKMRSKQTLWNLAWPETRLGRVRVQTFWPNTKLPPICIRAKIWAYGCQKSLAIQMPKLRKRVIHKLSLLKKGGLYLAALKKGGIRAHIRTMSNIGSYPPPPPPENVVRGDQKLCKRAPYNASFKVKQDLG